MPVFLKFMSICLNTGRFFLRAFFIVSWFLLSKALSYVRSLPIMKRLERIPILGMASGAFIGAMVGSIFGASVGITAGGGAENGVVLFAEMFGAIGLLAGGWFSTC